MLGLLLDKVDLLSLFLNLAETQQRSRAAAKAQKARAQHPGCCELSHDAGVGTLTS